MGPTVLVANVPSFNLFLLKRGFRARPGVVTKLILERDKFAVAQPVPELGGPSISHPARERGSGPFSKRCQVPVPHVFERVDASDQTGRGALPGDSCVSNAHSGCIPALR